MSIYTFGADPELFCVDTNTDKFVSPHEWLPGTKREPFKVEYGAVQLDGVAAEFNIDPADNFKDFKRNIFAVRKQMEEIIQSNGGKHLKLVAKPTATFDQDYFDKLPRRTKELGCEPDYCGEKLAVNPRPNAGKKPFRTGGGHFHIGWTQVDDIKEKSHFNDCGFLARKLYGTIGKWDYLWDGDTERRQLYGSKYSFRPKPFGMEYRYFSNAWVDSTDAMKFIFDSALNLMNGLDRSYAPHKNLTAEYVPYLLIPKSLRDANNWASGIHANIDLYGNRL